jgi:hypothetical protein
MKTVQDVLALDKVSAFLKRPVAAIIPADEFLMLDAIRKGVPAVALERDHTKSPVKELIALSDSIFAVLMPDPQEEPPVPKTLTKIGSRKRVEHES